jgi:hypothetical protein
LAHLVDVLVGAGSTEAVDTELLVAVSLPAQGGHDLNGEGRNAIGEDGEAVLLRLGVKDLETGDGDNTGLDAVVVQEVLGSVNSDTNLGTSRDESDLSTLNLLQNVTTLDGLLEGRTLELRKVLARQSNDARGVLGGQGNVVGSASLVTVGRAPDHVVGEGTEVSQSLNRLVSRTVLTKSNGVVGCDPDGADPGKGGQTDGTGSVGDEVEESARVWQNGTVSGKTVHDGTHGVLTDTVADIATSVVTEAGGGGLEVNSLLPAGKVGASQVSGTTEQLGNDALDLGQNSLGELAGSDGGVSRGVDRESLLPALGEVASLTANEVGMLLRELLCVLGEELVPLLLSGSTGGGVLAVEVVDLLGNSEALVGVEAELLLELLDIVGLEGRTVDTVGALVEGSVTDGGSELDNGRLVLGLLGLLDGSLNGVEVVVTIVNDENLPAVGFITLDNVLSEGDVGVSVNRNMVVVVDGNQVAKLEVTSERGGLTGDTLHQATIAEEAVGVVVRDGESGLVEGGGSVSLSHGKTDGIANTLSQRTSGHLNTWGVVSLGVAGGDAVDRLDRSISFGSRLVFNCVMRSIGLLGRP